MRPTRTPSAITSKSSSFQLMGASLSNSGVMGSAIDEQGDDARRGGLGVSGALGAPHWICTNATAGFRVRRGPYDASYGHDYVGPPTQRFVWVSGSWLLPERRAPADR